MPRTLLSHSASEVELLWSDYQTFESYLRLVITGTDLVVDPEANEITSGLIEETQVYFGVRTAAGFEDRQHVRDSRLIFDVSEGFLTRWDNNVSFDSWVSGFSERPEFWQTGRDAFYSDNLPLTEIEPDAFQFTGSGGTDIVSSPVNRTSEPLAPVFLRGGDDYFTGYAIDALHVSGGIGHDYLYVSGSDNTVSGGPGRDVLHSFGPGSHVWGNSGDDFVYAAGARQTLVGGQGNDFICVANYVSNSYEPFQAGDALNLSGGPGDDLLQGSSYAPSPGTMFSGGSGNDVLMPGAGFNFLHGDMGGDAFILPIGLEDNPVGLAHIYRTILSDFDPTEDSLVLRIPGMNAQLNYNPALVPTGLSAAQAYEIFQAHAVQVNEDVIFEHRASTLILRNTSVSEISEQSFVGDVYDLENNWGTRGDDLAIVGTNGDEHLYGFYFDDEILGRAGDDFLHGGIGDDTLWGGGGSDTLGGDYGDDILLGGQGRDVLLAHKGNDTLAGQEGADAFVLFVEGDLWPIDLDDLTGTALIADFDPTEDVLVLRDDEDQVDTTVDRYAQFHDGAVQVGAHVFFEGEHALGGVATQVILLNVQLDELTEDHFLPNDVDYREWGEMG